MAEVRLIDANVLIKDLTAMKSAYDAISLDGMIKALKAAPTIDPESLRPQGNWSLRCNSHLDTHTGEYDDEFYLECSVCRRQVWDIDIENTPWLELVKKFPYCHCGAKMNP